MQADRLCNNGWPAGLSNEAPWPVPLISVVHYTTLYYTEAATTTLQYTDNNTATLLQTSTPTTYYTDSTTVIIRGDIVSDINLRFAVQVIALAVWADNMKLTAQIGYKSLTLRAY